MYEVCVTLNYRALRTLTLESLARFCCTWAVPLSKSRVTERAFKVPSLVVHRVHMIPQRVLATKGLTTVITLKVLHLLVH